MLAHLVSWIIVILLSMHSNDAAYPSTYCIRFDTNIGPANGSIIVNVTQSWAPLGANHLYDIINSQFYSVPSAFFRVVPNFVLQFGISGSPAQNVIWNKPIKDDPVRMSNRMKTISYATAGPDTRTTQLFINYQDNQRLDPLGFAPFGIVTSGFDIAQAVFNPTPGSFLHGCVFSTAKKIFGLVGDPNGVDQDEYSTKGNAWILQNYPNINFIEKVSFVPACPYRETMD